MREGVSEGWMEEEGEREEGMDKGESRFAQ